MTSEELFLAIGQVEGSRLLRSELTVQEPSAVSTKEEPDMTKKRVSMGRIIRNVLIAAIIVSMLGVTAYAAAAYLIFDGPEDMISTIFGDQTGYDHKDITYWSDPEKPGSQYTNPAFDRVAVDETVMEEDVVPYVTAVGKSISWKGYTLTVDALMYDNVTKCGILTCLVENPDGVKPYEVEANGEVWNHPVDFNQYGYTHIIQEKTTPTCLALAQYFQYDAEFNRDMELTISQWTFVEPGAEYQAHIMELFEQIKQEYTREEAIAAYIAEHGQEEYDRVLAESTEEEMMDFCYGVLWTRRLNELYVCPETITVYPDQESAMKNITLADGAVTISPISMLLDVTDLDFLHSSVSGENWVSADNAKSLTIRYSDGTEYTVFSEGVNNTIFALNEPKSKEDTQYALGTYMFNRIIDVGKVASVVINGVELTAD